MAKKRRSPLSLIDIEEEHETFLAEMRGYQKELIKDLYDKNYVMVCWARRLGKDYMGLYSAFKHAVDTPNSLIYYILKTGKQARRIIINGKTEDKKDIISSIINPKELIITRSGKYVHFDNTIRFKNGSTIVLHGADSDDLVGTGVDLVVVSEAATFNINDIIEYLVPNTIQVGGKILLISTPRLGSKFNDLFLDEESIYHKSLIKATDERAVKVNGEPVYTEDKLSKARKLMSEEKYNQEYDCDMEQHNEESIYGKKFKKYAVYRPADYINLMPNEKIYISFDLGIRDLTALWFSVIRNGKPVTFNFYFNSGVSTQHYIDYLDKFIEDNRVNKKQLKLLMPHDANKRMDTGQTLITRAGLYKTAGFEVVVMPPLSITDTIEVTRCCIEHGDIEFVNNKSIQLGILETTKYEWAIGADGRNLGIPKHGTKGYSDIADSLEQMCVAFYWNKYAKEKKNNSSGVVIDYV